MNRRSFLRLTAAAPAAMMAGALAARETKAIETASVDVQKRGYEIGKGTVYVSDPEAPGGWRDIALFSDLKLTHG
jgi:hypothetical protein